MLKKNMLLQVVQLLLGFRSLRERIPRSRPMETRQDKTRNDVDVEQLNEIIRHHSNVITKGDRMQVICRCLTVIATSNIASIISHGITTPSHPFEKIARK